MEKFLKQNDVSTLPKLNSDRYENLFNVYRFYNQDREFYYYNITNKLMLPEKIDSTVLLSTIFDVTIPLTLASYKIYGTIDLWYILYMLNTNTSKPRFVIEAGEEILYLKPDFVNNLITSLNGRPNQ